ncbi:hypothetical protein AB0L49_02390 [Streptomyces antimycoticus]|uniref:hypothetical protein n=1 Tax=Streptomyces antimycoticus TaxID=68175 RepID=UPI0034392F1B
MVHAEFSQPMKHRTEFYIHSSDGAPVSDRWVRGQLPVISVGDSVDLYGAEMIVKKVTMKVHPDRPDHGEQAECIMRYDVWRLHD